MDFEEVKEKLRASRSRPAETNQIFGSFFLSKFVERLNVSQKMSETELQ